MEMFSQEMFSKFAGIHLGAQFIDYESNLLNKTFLYMVLILHITIQGIHLTRPSFEIKRNFLKNTLYLSHLKDCLINSDTVFQRVFIINLMQHVYT